VWPAAREVFDRSIPSLQDVVARYSSRRGYTIDLIDMTTYGRLGLVVL
jgi:hypothetical protein